MLGPDRSFKPKHKGPIYVDIFNTRPLNICEPIPPFESDTVEILDNVTENYRKAFAEYYCSESINKDCDITNTVVASDIFGTPTFVFTGSCVTG